MHQNIFAPDALLRVRATLRAARRLSALALVLAFAGTMLPASSANAASVRLFDTTYAVGPSGFLGTPPPAVPRITLPEAGTLTITLSPINVGSALSSLAFRVVDVDTLQAQPVVSGNGLQILQQSYFLNPGDVYLLSSGQTVPGAGNVGFFGLTADFAPIPLPLPAALLAFGLLGLGAAGVRRKAPGDRATPLAT
jgi:hypothetical protein